MKRYIGLITLSVLIGSTYCQEKWGKASPEILQMKIFPQDSSADAVVLFDVCTMQITPLYTLDYNRHVRLKILTEKGKEHADIYLTCWHDDKLTNIEAQSLAPDGKIVKIKKQDIFEESWKDNWKRKKLAIPAVQVGSVIEYRYTLNSKYITFLEPWDFQCELFTQLSQITLLVPPDLQYTAFIRNYMEDPEPSKEIIQTYDGPYGRFIWRLTDLPAVPDEPYMRAVEDYTTALVFQIKGIVINGFTKPLLKDWKSLAESVRESHWRCKLNGEVKKILAGLATDAMTETEKAQAIHRWVRDQIVTENKDSSSPQRTTEQILTGKKATASEKNLLFVNMARETGLQAQPLLLSTRNNGRCQGDFPQLLQFNYTAAWIGDSATGYLVDTSEKFNPLELPNEQCLVEQGLLIEKDDGKIISIPPSKTGSITTVHTSGSLSETGALTASSILRYEGYTAAAMRRHLEKENNKDYFTQMITGRFTDGKLDSFQVHQATADDIPLAVTLHYSVPEFAQQVGERLLITMPFVNGLKKNPFIHQKREFPVEFPYYGVESEEITLTLPTGYSLVEKPTPMQRSIDGAKYAFIHNTESGVLTIQRQMLVKKTVFIPREYAALRTLFGDAVAAEQQTLLIGKI